LWESAAAQGHLYACVELAKHFEHKERNAQAALKWAEAAMYELDKVDMPLYARKFWVTEIEHRMERLKRKAGI